MDKALLKEYCFKVTIQATEWHEAQKVADGIFEIKEVCQIEDMGSQK